MADKPWEDDEKDKADEALEELAEEIEGAEEEPPGHGPGDRGDEPYEWEEQAYGEGGEGGGEGGKGPLPANLSRQDIHEMVREYKQNHPDSSKGDAIRAVADYTGWNVDDIAPVADIVYGGGGGGGSGVTAAAGETVSAIEGGAEGVEEGVEAGVGAAYSGIEGLWDLIGSWLVFLVFLVGPLTAMNVMGVDMNAILGLTTVMMSGGAAVLYAYYTDKSVFGVDFHSAHWAWAAGLGIFFGIVSAFYGGGIVVAGAAVVTITIAWPVLGRGEHWIADFFRSHPGVAALTGTGITMLLSGYLFLIGVPPQLISVLIGVLAVSFYMARVRNVFVGLIMSMAWFYFTGRWAMMLIGGDFVNLTFGVHLLTSMLMSAYVIGNNGLQQAWEALHAIPGASDEWYEVGVVGWGIGAALWGVAVQQGTLGPQGDLFSVMSAWLIFFSVLLVGPAHLYRWAKRVESGALYAMNRFDDIQRWGAEQRGRFGGGKWEAGPDRRPEQDMRDAYGPGHDPVASHRAAEGIEGPPSQYGRPYEDNEVSKKAENVHWRSNVDAEEHRVAEGYDNFLRRFRSSITEGKVTQQDADRLIGAVGEHIHEVANIYLSRSSGEYRPGMFEEIWENIAGEPLEESLERCGWNAANKDNVILKAIEAAREG